MRVANEDYGHVALPKLFGAPAYARPPIEPVVRTERPVSPDDLPLEIEQTEEERELAQGLIASRHDTMASGDMVVASRNGNHRRRRLTVGLRAITGRVRGGSQDTTTDAG